MRNISKLIVVFTALLLLSGCGKSEEEKRIQTEQEAQTMAGVPVVQENNNSLENDIESENSSEQKSYAEASSGDFEYIYDEELGGIFISKYLGTKTDVRIPSTLDGHPVVAIELEDDSDLIVPIVNLDLGGTQYKRIHLDFNALESVIIPDGTTEILELAFNGCGSLKEVIVPPSVTKIGVGAFAYCGMEKLSFTGENNIEEIEKGAFNCCGIKELPFSEKLRIIRENAFESCYKLESVIIPEGTTTIEKQAFARCEELKEVSIADSVTEMGERVFDWCENLETVKLSKGISYVPANCFLMCGVKEVYIPGNIKVVESHAFDQCGLEKLTLEEGIVEIKECAFGMNNLKDVTLPNSIQTVANDAFGYCEVFYYAGNTYGRNDMLALFR